MIMRGGLLAFQGWNIADPTAPKEKPRESTKDSTDSSKTGTNPSGSSGETTPKAGPRNLER